MSLSRSSIQEVCDAIENRPSNVLGNKFFDTRLVISVDFSHKTDKFEPRILVISKFRIFFLSGKTPAALKIDRSYHVLSVRTVQVVQSEELSLVCEEGGTKKKMSVRGFPAEELALVFLRAIRHYFPDVCDILRNVVELSPTSLYEKTEAMVMEVSPRPCHSFRRTYAALCDLFDLPYREEVAWDVEKIYTMNNIRCLRTDDFSHLLPKDLIPIVAVLQYSSYFTGLQVEGIRLSAEMLDVIFGVIRYSLSLKHLQLKNCSLPREFIGQFAVALQKNQAIPLEVIDFSNNALDDKKGFTQLCPALARLPTLRVLNLADCSLSEKCTMMICWSLYSGMSSSPPSPSLRSLILASNMARDEPSPLVNLLSLCTSLRQLDLSDTQFQLDKLWPALKFGCLQLETLILAGCHMGKKGHEVSPAKEYFSTAVGLRHIDISRVALTSELLKNILLGLASNNQLEPFDLLLDASCEKCADVLEECVEKVQARSLSLRDNNLDHNMPGVVAGITRMTHLRRVDLGGNNVQNVKKSGKGAATLGRIVGEIVKLVAEDTSVEELVLSDAHLGSHLSLLLNSLGTSSTLQYLDISGNELGNFGARLLSKALQMNISLRKIILDSNHIGVEGFADIASALEYNHTLQSLPFPVSDCSESLSRGEKNRLTALLSNIESSLERNRKSANVLNLASKKAAIATHTHERGEVPPVPDFTPLLNEYVSKFREETSRWIRLIEGGDGGSRMEGHIGTILREWVERDTNNAATEWAWRVLCSSFECPSLRKRADTPSDVPSPIYRPRSIFAETPAAPVEDSIVDLHLPPKPSALSHPAKSRPRPARCRQIQEDRDSNDRSSPTCSLSSSGDGRPPVADPSPAPLPPETPPTRHALLPPSEPSPPPIPRRTATPSHSTPPLLPPKPDKMGGQPEDASNIRLSVADMAKMFQR